MSELAEIGAGGYVGLDDIARLDKELEAVDAQPISEGEKIVEAAEVEESWEESFAKQMRASEATGMAKAAVRDAAEAEDEVDPDKMEVVPNRKAKRDAYNLRGSIQPGRSRVRRRIHRVLVKRGTWS